MRKLPRLSTEWQNQIKKFAEYDEPQSFLSTLENSELPVVQSFRKYSFNQLTTLNQVVMSELGADAPAIYRILPWLGPLPDWLLMPYFRLSEVDRWERSRRMVRVLPQEDLCRLDTAAFIEKAGIADPWWNPQWNTEIIMPTMDAISSNTTPPSSNTNSRNTMAMLTISSPNSQPSWIELQINQLHKSVRLSLLMELTQKVLQVKETAAKLGRLPQQIPEMKSSVCQDGKWIYQVSADGTASISFSFDRLPEWLQPKNPGEQLSHQFKFQGITSNAS